MSETVTNAAALATAFQAAEAEVSKTISNVIGQSILAGQDASPGEFLSVSLTKDLKAVSARLDQLCDQARRQMACSEQDADESEREIKLAQDRIAECQQKKQGLEETRIRLQSDLSGAEKACEDLSDALVRIQREIESLTKKVKEAEERERVRKILVWIPLVNIGALIESALSDDKDTIRRKGWELQEKARQREEMQQALGGLRGKIAGVSDEQNKLELDISLMQTKLQQLVDRSLQAKQDMVKWSRVMEYFGLLKDRLQRVVKNSECDPDLLEWLDARCSTAAPEADGTVESGAGSELVRLGTLCDQSLTAMTRTPFYSGGAVHSEVFDDLIDDSNSCYTFPDSVLIRCGDIIDGIRFQYNSASTPLHGGEGGGPIEFKLEDDEYIVKAEGSYGQYWNNSFIHSLCFTTNKGRILRAPEPPRADGSGRFETSIPEGSAICGIFGEAAHPSDIGEVHDCRMLSGIGFYYRPIPADAKR